MDEFDVIDFVYDAVAAADTGVTIWKDKSDDDTKSEHIVINHLNLNEFSFHNKIHVNVNIFVPLRTNGTYSRTTLKTLRRKVRASIDAINSGDGNSREVEVLFIEPIPDAKEGFMCLNVRLEVLIDN
ncbi:MAG: hypothetical protein ACRCUJ_06470 [Phocaeicola sp.]